MKFAIQKARYGEENWSSENENTGLLSRPRKLTSVQDTLTASLDADD